MDSINSLINFLINAKATEINALLISCDDANEIMRKYKKDAVPERQLIELLQRSVKIKDLQWFLINIFFYINEKSITDSVFTYCLNYPGRFRKTLLEQLSHVWLLEEQLLKLNAALENSEAFSRLFVIYLRNSEVSVDKLLGFLKDNKKYLTSIEKYKSYLPLQNIDKKKIDAVDQLLKITFKK